MIRRYTKKALDKIQKKLGWISTIGEIIKVKIENNELGFSIPKEAGFVDGDNHIALLGFYIYGEFKKGKGMQDITNELIYMYNVYNGQLNKEDKVELDNFVIQISKIREYSGAIPVMVDLKLLKENLVNDDILKDLIAKQTEGKVGIVFVETEEGLAEGLLLDQEEKIVRYNEIESNGSIDLKKLKSSIINKFFTEHGIKKEYVLRNAYIFASQTYESKFRKAFDKIVNIMIVGAKEFPLSYKDINVGILKRIRLGLRQIGIDVNEQQLIYIIIDSGKAKDREEAIEWAKEAMKEEDTYLRLPSGDEMEGMAAGKTQETEL